MNFFQQGQRVQHLHSTASQWKPGIVREVCINEARRGVVWMANSYYVIDTDDGETYTTDLVDAHMTNGGMTRTAA